MAQRRRKGRRGGRGGGGLLSWITGVLGVLIVIGGVIGVVRVNDIQSTDDLQAFFQDWGKYINDCGVGDVEWNCDTMLPTPGGGTNDGGNPNAEQELKTSWSNLEAIQVADAQKVDYNRSEWRHWTGSPCNTRQQTLIDQGQNVTRDDKCKITGGEWIGPYTGEVFTNSSDLDIDHVIPLGYAARHGGNEWSADRKEAFANDPIHLLATSASANRSKSDKGPGDYMPDLKEYHCAYSKIWVNTVAKYDLTITAKDHRALEKGLKTC